MSQQHSQSQYQAPDKTVPQKTLSVVLAERNAFVEGAAWAGRAADIATYAAQVRYPCTVTRPRVVKTPPLYGIGAAGQWKLSCGQLWRRRYEGGSWQNFCPEDLARERHQIFVDLFANPTETVLLS